MANCPKCNRDWKWDWETDVFRLVDGTSCKEVLATQGGTKADDVWKYVCLCGETLGEFDIEHGAFIAEPEGWGDLDWELDEGYENPEYL